MGDTDETQAALARLMLIKSLATSGFPELAFVLVRLDQLPASSYTRITASCERL